MYLTLLLPRLSYAGATEEVRTIENPLTGLEYLKTIAFIFIIAALVQFGYSQSEASVAVGKENLFKSFSILSAVPVSVSPEFSLALVI